MAKLSDVCSLITDGSHFSPKDIGTGYPMLSVKDMKEKDFSFDGCKHISEEDYQTLLRNGCQPKKGDVLLAKDGSYFKYAFIVEEERELAVLSSIAILRPKVDIIDPRYLREFLMADSTYKTVSLNYISGTALKRVILQGIKKINVPLPAIEDQRKIAEKFIKLDQLIALRKEQLAKLDRLVKSRFIELFGDPVFNPKNWHTEKMNDIAPAVNYSGDFEETVWLLNLDMVEAQTGRIIGYLYVSKREVGNSTCSFDTSNVLYSKLRPYLNKVVIPDRCGYATSEMIPLKPNPMKLERTYLAFMLRSDEFVNMINKKVAGAKMPRVSMGDFREFDVPVPPIELQKQFAAFVEQIGKSKLAVQQSLDKLELLKKSLMQEYFG